MNVLMLQDDWWPQVGGGPNHVRELSRALDRQGHDVDVYTRALVEDGKRYDADEMIDGTDVTVVRRGPATEYHNPIGRLTTTLSMGPYRSLDEYDVVHAHTFLPAVTGQLCRAASGTPLVLTIHGTAIPSGVGLSSSGVLNTIERQVEKVLLLSLDYDAVVSVNREHIELLEPHHDHVTYVPNGVDLDRFESESTQGRQVLYLGRLAREKRVGDLVKAFGRLAAKYDDATLVIVGDGPERESLESLARRIGVADRVRFEGRVPDEAIPTYYATSDLFVLPSIWEGHPLTLLEAWASEKPVIATNVEGIREFVDHEETGYLVSPESPDELAEAIEWMLEHPEPTSELARAGYENVAENFTWEQTAREIAQVYERVTR